jgi:hypothetical protein
MKKIFMLPIILFVVGLAVYIFWGITDNAWMINLPNIIIFFLIIVLLTWARKKKYDLQQKRNNGEF